MDYKLLYDVWCQKVKDPELSYELACMTPEDISLKFGEQLKFGTAGARALIGAGPGRLNVVTVTHMSYALALYLKDKFENPSAVISYDTRKYSKKFAMISAQVLAANDVKVYFFDSPQPVGLLSFSIRYLSCSGGIMITASHNPPEYNGFKIYNSSGAQPIDTSEISENLINTDVFDIEYNDFEFYLDNKIEIIKSSIKQQYIENLKNDIDFKKINNIDIIYSPLNGCAGELFCDLFKKVKKIHIVKEQMYPDENFQSCKRPDPQCAESFKLSIDLAKQNNSDIIILNDPDGDRLGIALKYNNEYKILSGIEISTLLLNYLAQKKDVSNSIIVKSVVTGGLAEQIAKFHKIKCYNVLPGFKYISDFMDNLEANGNLNSFLMGFEESNGFLLNSHVRDKDGLSSSAFFCEMVSFYKNQNLNCLDVLNGLYKKFGYYKQKNISFSENDLEKISGFIYIFKEYFLKREDVFAITDYNISSKINIKNKTESKINFPRSNMISIEFFGNNVLFVRSSGTEPLIKIYILYNGSSESIAENNCMQIENLVNKIISHYYKC